MARYRIVTLTVGLLLLGLVVGGAIADGGSTDPDMCYCAKLKNA